MIRIAFLHRALVLTAVVGVLSESQAATPATVVAQVGRKIDSFTLQDYRGKSWSLNDLQGQQATVIAFVGVECPIVGQYASRLRELAEKYADRGVAFVAIDSNQQDSLTELAHFA